MLLIYSICRSHARHQISFPSVFFRGGEDWTIPCGGADLKTGTDYLVFGEIKTLGGGPFLAVEKAVPVSNTAYFTRVHGKSTEEGLLEGGLRVSEAGEISGELVAVDQSFLVVSGQEVKTPPSPASTSNHPTYNSQSLDPQEDAKISPVVDVKKGDGPEIKENVATEVIKGEGSEREVSPKQNKSTVVKPVEGSELKKAANTSDNQESSDQLGQTSAPNAEKPATQSKNTNPIPSGGKEFPKTDDGGAGEGVLVPGTIISVLSKPEEPFPESGAIPELAGVKRSELARKADARKKVVGVVAKVEKTVPAVSSSGIKLGKELGGDKKSPVVQNSIDEDELW